MRQIFAFLGCFALFVALQADKLDPAADAHTEYITEDDADVLEAYFGNDATVLSSAFSDVPGAAGLLHRHGYSVEIHQIVTADGYLLQLERIIGNAATNRSCRSTRRPVLMVHGLFDSSASWVVTGPNNSLATQLTDLCYDVWLGNCRGNRHSRRHVSRDPDGSRRQRQEFWSFSWHQIGQFDLPAMIDYVLRTNGGHRKLFYVGHSQGTTSFFVMASLRPEYNQKIQLASMLAPVAIMRNAGNTIGRTLVRLLMANKGALHTAGRLEFLPGDDAMADIQRRLCGTNVASGACQHILFLVAGYNPELANRTALSDILLHAPAGAAIGQVVHYGQLTRVTDFRQYDFGLIQNLRRYGSRRPPAYNVANIRAPVALYYSRNDNFAATQDVEAFAGQLPNVVFKHLVRHDKFNHLDFMWAINLRYWLNDLVVQQIERADN